MSEYEFGDGVWENVSTKCGVLTRLGITYAGTGGVAENS